MIVRVDLQADTGDLDKVARALAGAADMHRRTGIAAAAELERDRLEDPTLDVTAAALLVVAVLAEADMLERWSDSLRAAATTPQQPPAPAPAANAALVQAQAAVDAARARTAAAAGDWTTPTLTDLAAAHNAALTATGAPPPTGEVNGRGYWMAPEVFEPDDDDDIDADTSSPGVNALGALQMDMTQ